MKIQKIALHHLSRTLTLFIFSTALLACRPVSVGTWQTIIEIGNLNKELTWVISSEPALTIFLNSETRIEDIKLAGSRINWSTDGSKLPSLGISSRISFNGTVNGNELAGTLFTQQGNFTVTGVRLTERN